MKKKSRATKNHSVIISSSKTKLKKVTTADAKPQNFTLTLKSIFSDKNIVIGIVLFAFVTAMFAISVSMRTKYNYFALEHHNHLSATSVVFTNNWLDDGIINDHFAMIPNPESVEFETLEDRSFYDSYPPGCIIPLYILAQLSGTEEISFDFVRGWDLFNQYAITILLAFLVYLIFLKLCSKPYIGFAAAIAPTAVNLFMPSPFYFFHSVYFSDQGVLLPFVLMIFLEFIRADIKEPRFRRTLNIIQAVVIFAGTITDYLFLCVLIVVYIKRLVLKEIPYRPFTAWLKGSLKMAAPALLGIALFVLQIAVNGPVRILEMFLFRTGMEDSTGWTEHFSTVFWKDHIVNGFGANADIIIKASLVTIIAMIAVCVIIKIFKKRENNNLKMILSVAAILIVPCFMQIYLLKNHSAIHDFSALKFSLVMSVIPYVLIPAAVIEIVKLLKGLKFEKPIYGYVRNVFAVSFAVICCFTVYSEPTYKPNSLAPKTTWQRSDS